jgi:hypothetical protein
LLKVQRQIALHIAEHRRNLSHRHPEDAGLCIEIHNFVG